MPASSLYTYTTLAVQCIRAEDFAQYAVLAVFCLCCMHVHIRTHIILWVSHMILININVRSYVWGLRPKCRIPAPYIATAYNYVRDAKGGCVCARKMAEQSSWPDPTNWEVSEGARPILRNWCQHVSTQRLCKQVFHR